MQNENVVVKKVCHSRFCRPQDSGISTLFSSSPLEGEGGTQCRVRGYQRAFTLIELLVVVLIIGILAAVALPQYQKAVMKSRYSALMPIAKSIANGNEAYYLEHGAYTTSPASLDISGQDEKYPDGTEVDMSAGEYSYVLAKRDNLPLNYLVYQKHSDKFADNIHCEADENNTMAKEVCQGLGGELISGSQTEGYLTYVLSGTQGANDKLPTSISKLKAQLCAGISDENCVVDEDNEIITAYECGSDYGAIASNFRSHGGRSNSRLSQPTIICAGAQYDLDGNELAPRLIQCSSGTTLNADKTACVGTPTDTSLYETIQEGNMEYSKACVNKENDQCTQYLLTNDTYYDDGYTTQHKVSFVCESSQVKKDHTCSSYSALTGNQAPWGSETRYNPKGNQTWQIQCTHRNSDGTCTSMKKGTIRTYDTNGTTLTGSISIECTTTIRGTPCTEYRLSYNGNVTPGPATCQANNLNFDTFECSQS